MSAGRASRSRSGQGRRTVAPTDSTATTRSTIRRAGSRGTATDRWASRVLGRAPRLDSLRASGVRSAGFRESGVRPPKWLRGVRGRGIDDAGSRIGSGLLSRPVTTLDCAVLADLFGRRELREAFDSSALVQAWLDVEQALARAEAEVGVVPAAAADRIAS
jgi:hypothetical protein